jgi:glycosyltransferase involved in cell wall biosynthesis
MTVAPRVSVVMPAWNAARTIGAAMASVLSQSLPDLELVICDDASSDATVRVAESIADGRVRVLRQERNGGPGAARDRAIDVARGQWIAVIDADDAWLPDRLERLLAAAGGDECMVFDDLMVCHDAPGSAMVPWRRLHGTRAFGGSGAQARDVAVADYVRSERLLIKPLIPSRRIRDGGLRHSARRFGEDAEYFLGLAVGGLQLRYLPEPLYRYRVTPASATAEARDPALMRQCLSACASLPGFDAATRAAFADKLRQLREHEALHAGARALRAFDLRAALAALAAQPRSLLRAPRLLLRRIGYGLHRRATGGIAR